MQTFIKGERVRVLKTCTHLIPEIRGIECTVLDIRDAFIPLPMYIVKLDKPTENWFTELCLREDELEKS